jgi:hypothetical protein
MKKSSADYYFRRIYRLLSSDKVPIILKKIRGTRGQTDHKIIWLNPQENILPTLIHECLHILYPNWNESKVYKYEAQIFNQLTPRQIKKLLLRVALIVNKIKQTNKKAD